MFLHFSFLPENNIEHIMYNANPERRFHGIFPDSSAFFAAVPVIPPLPAGCLSDGFPHPAADRRKRFQFSPFPDASALW